MNLNTDVGLSREMKDRFAVSFLAQTKWRLTSAELINFHKYTLQYWKVSELEKELEKGGGFSISHRGILYTPIFYRCSYIDVLNRAKEGKMIVLSFRVPLATLSILPTVLITTSERREDGWNGWREEIKNSEEGRELTIEDYRTRDAEEQEGDILASSVRLKTGKDYE